MAASALVIVHGVEAFGTTPKKQQASEMVAQTLVRPAPPLLPPPCPASINPSSSPYQSALANEIISQVSGGPAKLKLKTATSLFLCSPQGLSFLHSRIPIALERHGEGRLDLEQLYAMVLPSVFKIATTKFGAALLLRLVQYSAPAQRQRMVLRLLPFINALAIHFEGHKVITGLLRYSSPDLQDLLTKEVAKAAVELSFCSPGSRVIQAAVKCSVPGATPIVDISQRLSATCFHIAKDKFGSKVLCTLLTCVAPQHTSALRTSILHFLPDLCMHGHGHRVVKRLYRYGSSKECFAVSRHLLNHLPALMASPNGSQLVGSIVLSRAPKSGDRGWQVLDKLVRLVVAITDHLEGEEAVEKVLGEVLALETMREVASGYLVNTGAVLQEMGKIGKGHRIEEYSWMQELAGGTSKPAVTFIDLPKFLLLLEITNGVLNNGKNPEVWKAVNGCLRAATVQLLKQCENLLKTGNSTAFELDELPDE